MWAFLFMAHLSSTRLSCSHAVSPEVTPLAVNNPLIMLAPPSRSVRPGGSRRHRAASGGDARPRRQEHRHLRGPAAQGAVLWGHRLEQVMSSHSLTEDRVCKQSRLKSFTALFILLMWIHDVCNDIQSSCIYSLWSLYSCLLHCGSDTS